ncbi:MAG: Gfo/Idh/MocA family oxidoreductase [Prochlorococcus marinus CUG1430]|uniref:Gfo/Idh/MocA family oxidoreductase n=2 Tax=Prochlorococcus marinus TaxID=1219 RepID=UPI001B1A42AE|nr:Gfo/Idh/MocA family oxidoreductase [Prochlorococcus marinus]MBW3055375.1 hypothetical protein [Prochlorococcus marinus str. MU1411]MCR8537119.1 Gfo/Idh/MocA family oxidoreductase [Prochlorococcus marinus CUG1430]
MAKSMKVNMPWPKVCLVGLGNHAKTKLLPILVELYDLNQISTVSSQINNANNIKNNFYSISESFPHNKSNCLYILSSPPKYHYSQAKAALLAGFDVMVEKPCFIDSSELQDLIQIAKSKKVLLIEMMMYLQNKIVNIFINNLRFDINKIKSIRSQFIIPSIPLGTFRNEKSLSSSLLADIGCYPLNFLSESGFDLREVEIETDKNLNKYFFYSKKLNDNHTSFSCEFGLGNNYSNYIKIIYKNDNFIQLSPFYYGRKGKRELTINMNNNIKIRNVIEENCFKKIFLISRNQWCKTQNTRFHNMIQVTETLQKLSKQVNLPSN